MTLEIRQLVTDVFNPDYDGRARHGDRAVGTLHAGNRIVVRREMEEIGGTEIEIVSFRQVHHRDLLFNNRKLVLEVIEASVPAEVATFKEFMMLHDEEQYTANRMLEHLYQNPETRPFVVAALQAVQEAESSR